MIDCNGSSSIVKEEFTIVIRNPLAFMTQEFMMKDLEGKYPNSKIETIIGRGDDLVKRVLVSFQSKELMEKYMIEFNWKEYKKMNYKMDIEEFKGCSTEVNGSVDELERKEIVFPINYAEMINTVYEMNESAGGLVFLDKEMGERQSKAVNWLLKKIGSNILKGQSVMTISLPVYIFDSRTMLQVFAYELSFASYYIERIYYTSNIIDKLKWATTLMISHLYISPLQSKPFCPILGETYQARIGNLNIYLEQTVHRPLIANFYCYDDNHLFKYYGHLEMTASTGANTCKANKVGQVTLEFKDGLKYLFYFPQVSIKGLTIGKKMFNYKQVALVVDKTNEYCSYIKFGPESKGFFKSVFSGKGPKTMPDMMKGDIVKLSDVKIDKGTGEHGKDKKARSFCSINGYWTKQLLFDNEEYWNVLQYPLLKMYEMDYTLPSDSRQREDLKFFIAKQEDESQKEKERLEDIQRNDKKLREDYLKKIQSQPKAKITI